MGLSGFVKKEGKGKENWRRNQLTHKRIKKALKSGELRIQTIIRNGLLETQIRFINYKENAQIRKLAKEIERMPLEEAETIVRKYYWHKKKS